MHLRKKNPRSSVAIFQTPLILTLTKVMMAALASWIFIRKASWHRNFGVWHDMGNHRSASRRYLRATSSLLFDPTIYMLEMQGDRYRV